MYLLVYVDDLILTGNQDAIVKSFIARLNKEFAIKDLGDLNYFIGLEVTYTNDGLFLNRSKYAREIWIVQKWWMQNRLLRRSQHTYHLLPPVSRTQI